MAERLAATSADADPTTVLLLVSELVTNAVLHARTPFTLTVRTSPQGRSGVRIEVQDDSSLWPTPASLSVAGMSGRGLTLVEAFATSWGVDPIPGDGKAVWCEVAGGESASGGDPLPAAGASPHGQRGRDGAPTAGRAATDPDSGQPTDELVDVVIAHLPVPALLAAKLQVEDVVRDLKVVLLDPASRADRLADQELRVARRLDAAAAEFAQGRLQMRTQALAAAARGDSEVTIRLQLPRSAAAAARRYRDALNETDALNRAGELLVGRSLLEHDRLRRWYLGEIISQLEAAPDGKVGARPS